MKNASKLLSLLLAAVLLCSLLPGAAYAASGTEEDPIPLKVGEKVEVPILTSTGEWDGGKYYSFTPAEDGEYTLLDFHDDGSVAGGKSTYLFAGTPQLYYTSSAYIQLIDEGRFYKTSGNDGPQYLLWDFDPDTETLAIDPGQGNGEMEPAMESVTYFPWYPVEDQIQHVVIGEGVTSVSPHAFEAGMEGYYAALEDVSFPSTLKSIGKSAFERCPSLKTVTFPAALEAIDEQAFELCKNLKSVTFEGATSLGWNAFELCESLEEVTVKDPNMTDFGFRPFFNSPWIRTVAAENKGAVVVNHVLIGAWQAWDKEEGDGILIIPDGVTKIEAGALHGITTDPAGGEEGYNDNWYLVEVVIPDSVTELVEDEFFGGPFDSCTDLERVTIGDGVTTIPFGCFEDDFELRIVNFGKNVRGIEASAFKNTFLPGDIAIPDTVEYIGKQAFQLTEASLGASWVEDHLGDKPYRPKDFLNRNVYMGPALTEIGKKAFDGWESGWDGVFTIQGYDGTYAEAWAQENEYSFESLGAAPDTAGLFKDVPKGAYYAEAADWAFRHGITTGTSADQFSPNLTCTRGQIVTFLWRAAGCPEPDALINPFTDVKPTDYYYKAVLWAYHRDVTRGTSDTAFSPSLGCTRGQVVTFLYRYKRASAVSGSTPFTDVVSGAYYADAVAWAVQNNVTKGTSATTFSPNATCTRGQVVTFLYRDMS